MLIDIWLRPCLNKKSYKTVALARATPDKQIHRQGGKLWLGVYHCAQCKKYHLTSKSGARKRR